LLHIPRGTIGAVLFGRDAIGRLVGKFFGRNARHQAPKAAV
jgi:hypothetical protein